MADLGATRELIAQSCRIVGKLDLTKGGQGHVSQRVSDDTVLIRARGPGESGLRFAGTRDIILVDMDGKMIEGPDDLEPPAETQLHTWIYKTHPDVQSVIHIHPPTVVLFTITNTPLLPVFGAYDPGAVRLLLDGIPVYDRSVTISNDALGQEFAAAIGDKKVCLMRGHGISTTGSTVEGATLTCISINELAEMNYGARLLREPQSISEEDLEVFRRMGGGGGGSGSAPRPGRDRTWAEAATWRYYCQLIGEEPVVRRQG